LLLLSLPEINEVFPSLEKLAVDERKAAIAAEKADAIVNCDGIGVMADSQQEL